MKISKNLLLIILISGSIILLSFAYISSNKKNTIINRASKGFAVVELFTSEGCSSCPPADAAIARLLQKNVDNTYILSFHVDYWNRLGWKDNFSKQEYSARQQQYAGFLFLNSVYTPQVIVNGTFQFVGSNENTLKKSVSDGIKNGSASNINISAARKSNNILLHYNITGTDALLLNSAIVLAEADTQVKRGENSGRTLHHVNIVMDLKVIEAKGSGDLTMEIPKELLDKPFKVIAYTQAKKSFKILGADEIEL